MKRLDYIEVKSPLDIDSLMEEVHGFHDTLLKEFQLINKAFVTSKKSMIMDFDYNARIQIQCQFSPIRFEFIFINVQLIQFNKPFEIYSGDIVMDKSRNTIELSLDDEFKIICQHMYYKTDAKGSGNSIIFSGQIPTPEMTIAMKINDDYRKCVECGESWAEKTDLIISTCPDCNRVTVLETIN